MTAPSLADRNRPSDSPVRLLYSLSFGTMAHRVPRYKDGQPSQYSGDRSYDNLAEFIESSASEYASAQLPMAPSDSDSVTALRAKPNPDGRVMEVDEAGLDSMIRQGPVLVDFYAPWCGQ